MLSFLAHAAAAERLEIDTLCGDMTAFSTTGKFGAAYNPTSSFRLLHSEDDAQAHLHRTAEALRLGGVYVLDMEFHAENSEGSPTTDEEWDMERDGVVVRATNDAVFVSDNGQELVLEWSEDVHLRGYTVGELRQAVARVTELEIGSWDPQLTRATGVSEFSIEPGAEPEAGRAMVVLRRR